MSETGRGQPKLLYDVASGSRSHEDLPNENEVDEHRGKTDLPFFDLSTIVAATDDFSSAKMLGHGGFGIVYKVLSLNILTIYLIPVINLEYASLHRCEIFVTS